jgi:hypothetical protein
VAGPGCGLGVALNWRVSRHQAGRAISLLEKAVEAIEKGQIVLSMRLPELLMTLTNCEKARSFSIYDRCKAKFEGFSFRA